MRDFFNISFEPNRLCTKNNFCIKILTPKEVIVMTILTDFDRRKMDKAITKHIIENLYAKEARSARISTLYGQGVFSNAALMPDQRPLQKHSTQTALESLADLNKMLESIAPPKPEFDLFLFTEYQWDMVKKQLPVKTAASPQEVMNSQLCGIPVEVVPGPFEFFQRVKELQKEGKIVGYLPTDTLCQLSHDWPKYSERKQERNPKPTADAGEGISASGPSQGVGG